MIVDILAIICFTLAIIMLAMRKNYNDSVYVYKQIADSEKRIRIIAEESRDAIVTKFLDRQPISNNKYIN